MSAFNRNVINNGDIANVLDPDKGMPRTLDSAPPGGHIPEAAGAPPSAPAPAPAGGPASGVTVPTADGYLTKLLKYVPLEMLGAYLFVEGLVISNVDDPTQLQTWLLWTLVITIVLTAVYARTVLNVVRISQIAMAALGIAVYVFATGGWFATTGWYLNWFSGVALAVYGVLVAVIKLPSLPLDK